MLIEQSVATQYGVLPSKQGDLSFADWIKLVGGLMPETPLGQVVAIRSEKEREIIQRMTPAQRQIRSEWTAHRAHTVSPGDAAEQMQQLSAMLAGLFGRG